MRKLRLSNEPLRWPNCCAACGAPATRNIVASCSVVTGVGYYILFVRTTHLRVTVAYPICTKHLWLARVATVISARNLFNLVLGVAWGFCALGVGVAAYMWFVSGKTPNLEALAWFLALFLFGVALYYLAKRFTPVRINNATKGTVTLSIANDRYAQMFMELNANNVLKEIPWWRRGRSGR